MMEILNSMGGARTSKPQHVDRPVIKVVPRGIVGERGGNNTRYLGKKSRVESSVSLPMIKQNRRLRQTQSTDVMTSRSESKVPRTKPLTKRQSHGSFSHRSSSPDQRRIDKQLLEAVMSKSQNDVSKLVSDSLDSMASLQHTDAWTKATRRDVTDAAAAASDGVAESAVKALPYTKQLYTQHDAAKRDTAKRDVDALPSIVDLTSEENIRAQPEVERKVEKMKFIDLFHQLVLWKKTSFLLDNLSFTQDLCDGLVEAGLFNADMMSDIMSHRYDVERSLKMLSLLGTHGEDCYDAFLGVLRKCNQHGIVKELKKTERFTKFGEQLPAVFHYFLNLSEFLNTYPHIARKLGEDEKEILKKFIEGHIEVGIRKNEEKVIKMAEKIAVLKAHIRELKNEIRVRTRHEQELEEALAKANRKIDELYRRLQEQQDISLENRNEARKLRHFRAQQEELLTFIGKKSADLEMPDLGPRQLSQQLDEMKLNLERHKSKLEKALLERQQTKDNMAHSNGKPSAGRAVKLGVGGRQPSKLGSRQNTKLSRGNTSIRMRNPDTVLSDLRLNQTQLNVLANKVYYMLVALQTVEAEEKRVTKLLETGGDPTKDKAFRQDMRKILTELRHERKQLKEQLTESERQLFVKEGYVKSVRRDILGLGTTPADVTYYKTQHDSLVSHLQKVLDHIKQMHKKDLEKAEEKRQETIKNFLEQIQDIKNKNVEEQGKLRLKIRTKISEINDREKILNRLKKQITTMANYASKNMNAQATVDECRKITRSMIGEARKLKAIAEEKDREKAELEKLEAIGDEDKIREFHEAKLRKEEKKQKALEKRKRKKKEDYLANDRLLYIADRLSLEWRVLGKCLGLTNNRMDMIEWDCPLNAKQDQICLAMLKAWRDEERGKIIELVEALRQMGRNDLAVIVLPLNRMHLLDKKKKKKKKGEESDDDDDEDDEEEEGAEGGELPPLPVT